MAMATSMNPTGDVEDQNNTQKEVQVFDYSKRAQWLRAAVLGANDGLLSTGSLMIGIEAVRRDSKTMILTGIAGLLAGAMSMAIGEFVSVYSQYDIEMAQLKREVRSGSLQNNEYQEKKKGLPSPLQAAAASACAFTVGAAVPLVGAAFIRAYVVRLAVVISLSSISLLGFGLVSAVLGGADVAKSSLRILIGGWFAMAITYGLTRAVGSSALGA